MFLLYATTAIGLPAQTFTVLHSFDGTDGGNPLEGLVQATDGNFYGTTLNGGAPGPGTVFKITPSGTLTTLYTFCSQGYPCRVRVSLFQKTYALRASNFDFEGVDYAKL